MDSIKSLPARARTPQQARSRETLERILDTTEKMLDENSFENAPVSAIVKRAGSSVGSFYARFPDKDALIEALLERDHQSAMAELGEYALRPEWQRKGLRARVRGFVSMAITLAHRRRGLTRLRFRQGLAPEGVNSGLQSVRNQELVAVFKRFFAPVMKEIRHRDRDEALNFAFRIVSSMLTTRMLLPAALDRLLGAESDEWLENELSTAVIRYLVGRER